MQPEVDPPCPFSLQGYSLDLPLALPSDPFYELLLTPVSHDPR